MHAHAPDASRARIIRPSCLPPRGSGVAPPARHVGWHCQQRECLDVRADGRADVGADDAADVGARAGANVRADDYDGAEPAPAHQEQGVERRR